MLGDDHLHLDHHDDDHHHDDHGAHHYLDGGADDLDARTVYLGTDIDPLGAGADDHGTGVDSDDDGRPSPARDRVNRILGVDPGMSGAIALIGDDCALLGVRDIESADGAILAGHLVDVIVDWAPTHAVIEGVHSMPGQGVSTTFKFGRAFGTVEGITAALGIPTELISPAHWKRLAGVTKDKASSRARAARLWPASRDLFARVKDDGRAEAALIAVAWYSHRS